MDPISNLTIRKVRPGRLSVSFNYARIVPGFDHNMVLVVEQDGIGDVFELRPRRRIVMTEGGPVETRFLDFFNVTYNRFWNEGSTAGDRDDVGNRRWLNKMDPPLKGNTFEYSLAYNPGQTDENHTSTRPGLEFYALVAVVATVNGQPAAQLGNVVYSNQLAGA